jgi:hypothetical protein
LSAALVIDWETEHQRRLVAELARIRVALERHAARAEGTEEGSADDEAGGDDRGEPSASSSLDLVVGAFHLSPFERDLLLLCAAVELDGAFASLCARAQGDGQRTYPTFSLALAALPAPHWNALTPDAPLRYWRLIDVGPSESLVSSPLRIEERVLHFLTGVQSLDERLRGVVAPIPVSPLPEPGEQLAGRLAAMLDTVLVEISGSDTEGRRSVAAAAGAEAGRATLALGGLDVPAVPAERETLARLLERERALTGALVVIDLDEDDTEHARVVAALAETLRAPCIVCTREPLRAYRGTVVRVDLPPLEAQHRRRLLLDLLEAAGAEVDGDVDVAAHQFQLGPAAMCAAVSHVVASQNAESLWDACRLQARPRLDDFAQRIDPVADWDELVLPAPIVDVLRQVAVHVRQRARVYDEWGFGRAGTRGLGISALFAGPSGTGKTMAAEVLARELRLDLYRVDLSSVVSKYIGETEKNLRRVFDAADEGGVILLFDEADALFGRRSEVKDSHDRYANIEVSYLLQRMEAYRGLAILTTNQRQALDPAFQRRLRFVIQFPFPDTEQRAGIWRRIFPADTPVDGLEPERLAQLNVAGGNIRNIALAAAFLTAESDEPVRMLHVLRATRGEYAKLDKPLSDTETAGWL